MLVSLLRSLPNQTHPHHHLAPASLNQPHLSPSTHCLLRPPTRPVPPPCPGSQLNSLPPLTTPGPPPRLLLPALLLNPPPLPWNLTPPDLTNSPDLTQPPPFLLPYPFLLPAPFQAPVSYSDDPQSGLHVYSPFYSTRRSAPSPPPPAAVRIPLQHLSFLSPWDPAPSRVTTPPDSTPDPLAPCATWPRSLRVRPLGSPPAPRKPAPRPRPALGSVLPRPLVAAAPAPAPQAAAVASPPLRPPRRPSGWSSLPSVRVSVGPLRPTCARWGQKIEGGGAGGVEWGAGAARGSPTYS